MSSKVPDLTKTVLPRTASALLPQFQELLAKWPVDQERLDKVPHTPDVGTYLREYTDKSVASNGVSYEAAAAELEAAQNLARSDFFSIYQNIPVGHGLSGSTHQKIRKILVDPGSPEAKKAYRAIGAQDFMDYRKGQIKSAFKILFGLYLALGALSLWNRSRNTAALAQMESSQT
eukprot:sb/3471973/